MQRVIKAMEQKYLQPFLEMGEDMFAKWDSPEEGKTVRSLVEENVNYLVSALSKEDV